MLQHIKLKIRASQLDSNKHYRQVKMKVVEDTTQTDMARGKYLHDIVCHALTHVQGCEISSNERFTYTFPFNL